jgi:hypothetical protein
VWQSSEKIAQKGLAESFHVANPSNNQTYELKTTAAAQSKHSYLRDFFNQANNSRSLNSFKISKTETKGKGSNNYIIDEVSQMRQSNERDKILDYVRSSTASSNVNPRR